MAQFLRPVSDVYAGAWTPSTGSTRYGVIDEASANDSDYIEAPTSVGVPDPNTTVKLDSGTDPGVSSGHKIHARLRRSGGSVSPTVELYQGDPIDFGSILVATLSPTVTGSYADYEYELNGTQADSITDYTDLHLVFMQGSGGFDVHYCSQAYFEVPDVGGGGTEYIETVEAKNAQAVSAADTLTSGVLVENVTVRNAQFVYCPTGLPPVIATETVTVRNAQKHSAATAPVSASDTVQAKNAQRLSQVDVYVPREGGSTFFEFVQAKNAHRAQSSQEFSGVDIASARNAQKASGAFQLTTDDQPSTLNAQRVGGQDAHIRSEDVATAKNGHRVSARDILIAIGSPAPAKNAQKFTTVTAGVTAEDSVTSRNAHSASADTEALEIVESAEARNAQKPSSVSSMYAVESGVAKNAHSGSLVARARLLERPVAKNAQKVSYSDERTVYETVRAALGHRVFVEDALEAQEAVSAKNAQRSSVASLGSAAGLIPAIRFNIKQAVPGLHSIPEAAVDGTIADKLKLPYAVIVAGSPVQTELGVNDTSMMVPVDIVLIQKVKVAPNDTSQLSRATLKKLQDQILADYQMFGETSAPSAIDTRIVSTPYDRMNQHQQYFSAQHQQDQINIMVLSIECWEVQNIVGV